MWSGLTRLQRSLLLFWLFLLVWVQLENALLRWGLAPERMASGWAHERMLDRVEQRGAVGEEILGAILRHGPSSRRKEVLRRLVKRPRYTLLHSVIWTLSDRDDEVRSLGESLLEQMLGRSFTAEDFSRSRGEEIQVLVARLGTRPALESFVARIGLPAVPFLTARLRDRRVSSEGRAAACRSLAAIEHGVTVDAFLAVLEERDRVLGDAAVAALVRRGATWRSLLRQRLVDASPAVARGVARALCQLEDRGSSSALLAFFRSKGWRWGDKRRKLHSLALLCLLRDPEAVAPLRRWMDVEEDPEVQVEIVRALVASGRDQVVEILADYCCVASPALQLRILAEFERLGSGEVRRTLANMIHQGSFDGEVLQRALDAQNRLASRPPPRGTP